MLAMLAEICQQRQFDLATLRGGLLFDPLGALATHGVLPYSCETVPRLLGELGHWAATAAPHFTTVAAQSAPYHESGGHAAQELADTMAAGVAYLRLMQQAGLSIDAAAARLRFVITVGSQFFLEVAKLRRAGVFNVRLRGKRRNQKKGDDKTEQVPHLFDPCNEYVIRFARNKRAAAEVALIGEFRATVRA